MIHAFRRGVAAVVASVLLTTAASSAIVLNNGLIIVRNDSGAPATVRLLTKGGHIMESATLPAGQSFESVHCCYAAGTEYRIYVAHRTPQMGDDQSTMDFDPRICNRNGIPYGFARFLITGRNVLRVDFGCYEGPL